MKKKKLEERNSPIYRIQMRSFKRKFNLVVLSVCVGLIRQDDDIEKGASESSRFFSFSA